ncbi:MAG: DUF2169 domain-containing protein [Pseudomonadota bacterium]
MAMDIAGREHLLFVAKATYGFPDHPDDVPQLCPQQMPLVMADEYTGEPGASAPLWETDFAFRKARCDVVVNGAAYAPGGKPTQQVQVGVKVGAIAKTFNVLGPRSWQVVGPAITATHPAAFTKIPLSYNVAFGGICDLDPDDEFHHGYEANPAGQGFGTVKNQSRLSGTPLPLTEELGAPVTSPYEDYRPMAFGPISRADPVRRTYGGTYDQAWQDDVFPFLPADFDERYFQHVGPDQQIEPPRGGTQVVLVNLTPRGKEAFRLPETGLPLTIWRDRELALEQTGYPDTLLIDAEARVFSLVWRFELPIRRVITEFTQFWIGTPSAAVRRAHTRRKPFTPMTETGMTETDDA